MPCSTALPLTGIVVLVTRASGQAAQLVSKLNSLGARVYAIPAIETEPLSKPSGLKEALLKISEYDHLVFTSVNGVYFFLRHLEKTGTSPAQLPQALCVGPKTAETWRKAGGIVSVVPEKYTAGELLSVLGDDLSGISLLVLRPDHVKTELGLLLRKRGAKVDEIVLYRTLIREENARALTGLMKKDELDAVLFASPSAVEGTLSMMGDREKLQNPLVVCIGPTTARAALDAGLERVVFPEDHTVDGMISLLIAAAGEMRDRR
jgi:uroporphyrinogen III methyltransferase/synthase